ncbi:hypothetical protein L1887_61704 [Cichorium endivia]|nr:hypothetical protein L1887_61704 [Cichorium endivia]
MGNLFIHKYSTSQKRKVAAASVVAVVDLLGDVPAVGCHLGARAEAVERRRVERDGVRDGLGVDLKRLHGEVVDGVASRVVVGVVCDARLAAKQLGLLLGLETLGTSVETASSDASVQERTVVAAAIEGSLDQRLFGDVLEKVKEHRLGLRRSGRAGGVEGAAIAVVHAQHIVGRGDHVKVEVDADLVLLLLRELADVVLGAQQAVLLGRPPGKADRVVDAVLGQILGDGEQRNRTGSVVVDSGTGGDAVRVRTQHEYLVLGAAARLGDDIVRGAVLDDALELHIGRHLFARSQTSRKSVTSLLVDAGDGHKGALGRRSGAAKRARHIARRIVVDEHCSRLGRARACDLDAECASASLNQCDLALDARGEVGLVTSEVVDGHEFEIVELAVGRVGERVGLDRLVVDRHLGRVLGVRRREGLQVHVVVVARLAQLALDVLHRRLVPGRAKHAVALRGGVGDLLQPLGAVEKILALDIVAEAFLLVQKEDGGERAVQYRDGLLKETYGFDRALLAWSGECLLAAKQHECKRGELEQAELEHDAGVSTWGKM